MGKCMRERGSIHRRWRRAGEEPALEEVLADPVIHAVMRRDGVTLAELQAAIRRAQQRLQASPCRCAA